MDRIVIKYKGHPLDVSSWMNDHPGGTKALRLFHDRDCTDTLVATHSKEAIERVEKRLPKVYEENVSDEVKEYLQLFNWCEEQGYFKPCYVQEIPKFLYSVGPVFLGYHLLLQGHDLYGSLLLVFGWFQCGWLGHEYSHHQILPKSNSYWCQVNNFLTWIPGSLRGTTAYWWKMRHNTHHVVTNQIGQDPDIKLLPVFQFFEQHVPNSIQRFQAWYYLPIISLLHLYWAIEAIPITLKYAFCKNRPARFLARLDLLGLFLFYYAIYYYLAHTGKYGVLLMCLLGSGFATAIIVFASHVGEHRIEEDKHHGIIRQTSISTRNICGYSGFDDWILFHLSGALSLQIEHHLFPMMPRPNLYKIKNKVKELFKKLDLEYQEDTLPKCTWRCIMRLSLNVDETTKNTENTEKSEETIDFGEVTREMLNEVKQLSSFKAFRMILRASCFAGLGLTFTHGIFLPVSIFFTCLALTAFYLIGRDCRRRRFFRQTLLNEIGAVFFRAPTLMVCFAGLFFLRYTLVADQFLHAIREWSILYSIVFLIVILNLNTFKSLGSKYLGFTYETGSLMLFPELRRLVDFYDSVGTSLDETPPTLAAEVLDVPMYNMPILVKRIEKTTSALKRSTNVFEESTDDSAKEEEEQPQTETENEGGEDTFEKTKTRHNDERFSKPKEEYFVDAMSWPMRTLLRRIMFWESRNYVLYAVVFLFYLFLYLKLEHPWTPLLALIPLVGPKSRAAKKLRKLQFEFYPEPRLSRSASWLRNINWPVAIYISLCHVFAFYAIFRIYHNTVMWQTFLFAFILWPISGFGITGGAHRLWAHKSYTATPIYRGLVMIMNSIANQGTIYHWSRDHRVHHKFSDTSADPHNARRGFFFSHMGWLFLNKDPRVIAEGKALNLSDLKKDYFVMLQKVCDPFWNLSWCFAFPTFFCNFFWGESLFTGFLIAGMLRYVYVLHCTWMVNSVVHKFGPRPYSPEEIPTESLIVAFFAIGEGWHSYHHAFPADYATAELGVLSQYNPTKLLIDLAARVGLVTSRKRSLHHWHRRLQRWVEEREKETGKKHKAVLTTPGLPFCKIRHVEIVEDTTS